MRIGFVAEPYEESHASGMGYVVLEYMRNLPLGSNDSLTIFSSKQVSKEVLGRDFSYVQVPKGLLGKFFYFLRYRDVDVLLFIAPLLPLVPPRVTRSVMICQELASQKTPVSGLREKTLAFVRDQILMPRSLSRARLVIAASGATKKDIHAYYSVPEEKVRVVYDGYQDLSVFDRTAPAVEERLKPFFFFAGKVKSRKNVHGIVSAFVHFKKRIQSPVKLVIAGDYGGLYYENMVKELKTNNLEADVFFVGYASGARLYSFYKNALALVFPSFNEGFGMPPVEAMSLGLPVITSNVSSMAEVVGDAGLLVNPHDLEDISKAMERIYTDAALRERLIERGMVRSKDFSWPKAAREVMGHIRTVV
ncbi:MAG TPA: glycosyltransferase family 1 protein [Candidatus Paceibacterota bacterium]|nr:glycosyltransferase family 1 protein [Candidatus Paceibacterota bacterium]